MTDVLENWVKLVPGIEKKLRFSGGIVTQRPITDGTTKQTKVIRSLVLRVTHEDGVPVEKDFSIVSERLASELSAYLDPVKLVQYEFTLLKEGVSFGAPRLAKIEPVK